MSLSDRFYISPAWPEARTEDEWRDERRKGIGGSEIYELAGLSQYGGPFRIYHNKVNGIDTFDGNEASDLGNLLEAPIAQKYAEVKGYAVVEWPVTLRSKEIEFVSLNVDRFVVVPTKDFPAGTVTVWKHIEPPPTEIIGLLEVKTGALASPGKPQEWFPNRVPDGYLCQGCWYGGALGVPWVDYAALIGGHGIQYRHVQVDLEFYRNLVVIARDFWHNHYLPRIEPPPDATKGTEETLKILYPRQVDGKIKVATDEFTGLWWEFQKAKKYAEEMDEVRKVARNRVVAWIGDADSVVLPNGDPLCTYRKSKDSVGIDKDALKNARPDVFQEFEKTSQGSRKLLDKTV